jgi:hypothetical protein
MKLTPGKNKKLTRPMWLSTIFLLAAFFIILGPAASPTWALHDRHGDWDNDNGEEIPFDVAELYFELNDTDGDLGIHSLIDGDVWKSLKIEDPKGREMLDVSVTGRLGKQGLTEIFFESAEPSFDELAPEQFFRRFPEGEYEIEGLTLEGEELESTAQLSHVMPAPPGNIKLNGVYAAEDCDVVPLPVVSTPVIISWEPVIGSHPEIGEPGAIVVDKYQVVVEREEPTLLVFSVDLPPDVTSIEIPEGFTELGDEFKFEILVRATNGNQTAVESCFIIE